MLPALLPDKFGPAVKPLPIIGDGRAKSAEKAEFHFAPGCTKFRSVHRSAAASFPIGPNGVVGRLVRGVTSLRRRLCNRVHRNHGASVLIRTTPDGKGGGDLYALLRLANWVIFMVRQIQVEDGRILSKDGETIGSFVHGRVTIFLPISVSVAEGVSHQPIVQAYGHLFKQTTGLFIEREFDPDKRKISTKDGEVIGYISENMINLSFPYNGEKSEVDIFSQILTDGYEAA